jgi:hypothetical protein
MKPLTQKDLPALAEIVREVTRRKVLVYSDYLDIIRNGEIFASMAIRGGRIVATKKITGFDMEFSSRYTSVGRCWQVVNLS